MRTFPTNVTVEAPSNIPHIYWPQGTNKVKEIGKAFNPLGLKLSLYPKEHRDVLMKMLKRTGTTNLMVNPLLFTLFPMIDATPSETPEFVSDEYGIMTCDLIQIALRANVANIRSCHQISHDCLCFPQAGYLSNPFFSTIWIYKGGDQQISFRQSDTTMESMYDDVMHKRNINPLCSVNAWVRVNSVTGERVIFLTRMYGDLTHYKNALPKLIAECEKLGFRVVSHNSYSYFTETQNTEHGTATFLTIPTLLQITTSRSKEHINPFRQADIDNPKVVSVKVKGETFEFNTFMSYEYHTGYPYKESTRLLVKLSPNNAAQVPLIKDVDFSLLHAEFANFYTTITRYDYAENPNPCLESDGPYVCASCGEVLEHWESMVFMETVQMCKPCVDKVYHLCPASKLYFPKAECKLGRDGELVTPHQIENGYYVKMREEWWVTSDVAWVGTGYVPRDEAVWDHYNGRNILKGEEGYCNVLKNNVTATDLRMDYVTKTLKHFAYLTYLDEANVYLDTSFFTERGSLVTSTGVPVRYLVPSCKMSKKVQDAYDIYALYSYDITLRAYTREHTLFPGDPGYIDPNPVNNEEFTIDILQDANELEEVATTMEGKVLRF